MLFFDQQYYEALGRISGAFNRDRNPDPNRDFASGATG
jgi:hypothetical protein